MAVKELEFRFVPAKAFTHGRTLEIQSIIVHSSDGRKNGDIATLTGPKVSSHWYVTRKGDVFHFVDNTDTAFHAGRVSKPKFSNSASLGIEQEHFDPDLPDRPNNENWPDVQIQAVANLCAFLLQKHNLPTENLDEVIKSHAAVAVDQHGHLGRKQDPFGYPFPKLFGLIETALKDTWVPININGDDD